MPCSVPGINPRVKQGSQYHTLSLRVTTALYWQEVFVMLYSWLFLTVLLGVLSEITFIICYCTYLSPLAQRKSSIDPMLVGNDTKILIRSLPEDKSHR